MNNTEKYVCKPDKNIDDLSCILSPCTIRVPFGSPSPRICPYQLCNGESNQCEWIKVNVKSDIPAVTLKHDSLVNYTTNEIIAINKFLQKAFERMSE